MITIEEVQKREEKVLEHASFLTNVTAQTPYEELLKRTLDNLRSLYLARCMYYNALEEEIAQLKAEQAGE